MSGTDKQHVMEDLPNNRASLEKHFEAFKASIPEGLTVKMAAEYMLDAGFAAHLDEGLLTMGYDKQVLVETSYMKLTFDAVRKWIRRVGNKQKDSAVGFDTVGPTPFNMSAFRYFQNVGASAVGRDFQIRIIFNQWTEAAHQRIKCFVGIVFARPECVANVGALQDMRW